MLVYHGLCHYRTLQSVYYLASFKTIPIDYVHSMACIGSMFVHTFVMAIKTMS